MRRMIARHGLGLRYRMLAAAAGALAFVNGLDATAASIPIRRGYYVGNLYGGINLIPKQNPCRVSGLTRMYWNGHQFVGGVIGKPVIQIQEKVGHLQREVKSYLLYFGRKSEDFNVLTPSQDGFDLNEEHYTWCASTLTALNKIPKEPPRPE